MLYPGDKEIRDYFSWRQADSELFHACFQLTPAHINNLYNTCFWALVHDGLTPREANKELQGTNSKDKNELLFSRFKTNYNDIPPYFRKGSTLVRVDPNPLPVTIDIEGVDAPSGPNGDKDKSKSVPEDVEDAPADESTPRQAGGSTMPREKRKPYEGTTGEIAIVHEDIIRNPFWRARPWLLA